MFSDYLMEPGSLDAIDEMLIDIKESNKPIVVFGCGSLAREATRRIHLAGLDVDAYCEGNEFYRDGQIFEGKKVIHIEKLCELYKECALVLAASGDNVYHYMANIKNSKKFPCDIYSIYDKNALYEMQYSWIIDHQSELNETYNMLADEDSKKIFLAFINAKANCIKADALEKNALYKMWDPNQYFNDLYPENLFDKHVLLDCGAYIGDTAQAFLEFLKDTKKELEVYAFEPDDQNFEELKFVAQKDDRIKPFHYGVGERTEKLYFEMEGTSRSKQVPYETDYIIDVVNIDEMFNKRSLDHSVSIIKMDLEGAEAGALRGMRELISENMPMLAICVYHKAEDLIEIPKLIKQIEQETSKTVQYKYYLRHHSNTVAELVFYAVPEVM